MSIALIAAIAKNNCIGKNGKLPWNIPEDLHHFREFTLNKTVLMGRKTWESIPEQFRPLPHRLNIVISRQTDYVVPKNVELYSSVDEALHAHQQDTVFVIGGEEIYRKTIERADALYITHVNIEVDGDAFFPDIDMHVWKMDEEENYAAYRFVTYRRT